MLLATVGVLAAACGGGPAPSGAAHTGSQKSHLLAFSAAEKHCAYLNP